MILRKTRLTGPSMQLWDATFAAGVGIGLAVAMPIGPMGVLCIQRTLSFGLAAGVTTGMGAATVHTVFGSAAAFGLSATLAAQVDAGAQGSALVSAAVLFWFAARLLRRQVALSPHVNAYNGWLKCYSSAFLFGLSNPMTLLLFAAILPFLGSDIGPEQVAMLATGVFAGSIGWWIVLSSLVASVRHRLSERMIGVTNKLSGAALAGLGAITCAGAFGLRLP